jgi:capsular exopolysaccharide synthesis family protein
VIDYQTFRNNTVIEVVDNSRLFTIAFRNPSPQIAKQVADELANQLITTVPEIIGVNNIQIVDTALLPEKPVTPSLLYNAIIGGALALILAFFVIVLSYLRKDPISSEAELENLTGVSVLGRIPEFKAELRDQSTLSNPTSKVAECFQILSTNLSFAVKEPEVLLLTSAIRSEGKSTTISNLANTYARSQKRVLLIDADLRLARIAHIYDINKNHPGLTDLLVNDLTLSAVLYSVESYQKFDILSAGNQQVSPSELLNSDAFEKLINDFRKDYDLILIDTPPVLNLADTNIISKVADGLLLVIASDQTSKTMVVAAKNSIEKAGGNLRGIILTKVKSTSHAAYHYDPKYKD